MSFRGVVNAFEQTLAAASVTIGAVVILLGLVELADPAGTKLSDDADPFGPPPATWETLIWIAAGVALVAVPLLIRQRRRHRALAQSRGRSA